MTCFKSEEYTSFDLLHHAEFSFVQRPQIKLIYFCIEDGNSPLFNDQLLIKRADNAPRKVTKISSRLNTFIYCGNDFNLQQASIFSFVSTSASLAPYPPSKSQWKKLKEGQVGPMHVTIK